MNRLGIAKSPQGWNKISLVLDSRWPLSSSGQKNGDWRRCRVVTVRKTHKFFCAWKVKELHQPKVISCDNIQASMGHTCAVDISLVCIPRPDANDFISQNAVPTGRDVRRLCKKASCSWASSPRDKRERGISPNSVLSCDSSDMQASVPSPSTLAPAVTVLCPSPFHPKKKSYLHLWFSPSCLYS